MRILNRVKTIEIRKQLTDEWKNRGVSGNKDFSILTATIAKVIEYHIKIKKDWNETIAVPVTTFSLVGDRVEPNVTA